MKKLILIFAACFLLCNSVFANTAIPSASILKPYLSVRAVKDVRYWQQPKLDNYWSWMPKLEFTASGPIADSSYFTYEFFTPDGKPWFSHDSAAFAIEEGATQFFESEAVPSWQDKRSSIATGVFSFKITLKNGLGAAPREMYRGKFKVSKFFAGTPHPDFKNEYVFYVDQDWRLPIGYLWLSYKQDANSPTLATSMWFRGQFGDDKVSAYLFYNGKKIAGTKDGYDGSSYVMQGINAAPDDTHQARWELRQFDFFKIRGYDKNGEHDGSFLLHKNPGNYEIKVLLDDELVRIVSFTVGSDGKIVDNGVAAKNAMDGMAMIIPVKVASTKEGTLDLSAWKTDAFYSNPLTGFLVQ